MKKSSTAMLDDLYRRVPALGPCRAAIEQTCVVITQSVAAGGKVLACGNGGSAADAEHIVGELMNRFLLRRPVPAAHAEQLARMDGGEQLAKLLQRSIPAISLVSQVALTTAVANDSHADMVFAQQVYGYGNKGDVLVVISTSGNAPNITAAARVGHLLGLRVVGLTGQTGGALRALCDIALCMPSTVTYQVQELHVSTYHAICAVVENEMFGA